MQAAIAYAAELAREDQALVTLDTGFADIRTYPPRDFPGLIVLRPERQSKVDLLEILQRMLPILANETLSRRLWIVEPNRIRVRE